MLAPRKEEAALIPSNNSKPADVLIRNFAGKPLALDRGERFYPEKDPTGPVLYSFSRDRRFARQTIPAGLLQQPTAMGTGPSNCESEAEVETRIITLALAKMICKRMRQCHQKQARKKVIAPVGE